jgi:hypothetical protein
VFTWRLNTYLSLKSSELSKCYKLCCWRCLGVCRYPENCIGIASCRKPVAASPHDPPIYSDKIFLETPSYSSGSNPEQPNEKNNKTTPVTAQIRISIRVISPLRKRRQGDPFRRSFTSDEPAGLRGVFQ